MSRQVENWFCWKMLGRKLVWKLFWWKMFGGKLLVENFGGNAIYLMSLSVFLQVLVLIIVITR